MVEDFKFWISDAITSTVPYAIGGFLLAIACTIVGGILAYGIALRRADSKPAMFLTWWGTFAGGMFLAGTFLFLVAQVIGVTAEMSAYTG